MTERTRRAFGWFTLTTSCALFASALYRQQWDAWTDAQLRKNLEPAPIAALVFPMDDFSEISDYPSGFAATEASGAGASTPRTTASTRASFAFDERCSIHPTPNITSPQNTNAS